MSPVGDMLRSERETKGVSRVDVSQATKVAVHHIAALEYSDFKELPDEVHVKGYVRAYAEYLGLEPAAVLEAFLEEYQAARPPASPDPRDETVRKMAKMLGGSGKQQPERRRAALVGVAAVVFVALAWIGWLVFGPSGDAGRGGEAQLADGSEVTMPEKPVVFREPGEAGRPVAEPAQPEPATTEASAAPAEEAAPETAGRVPGETARQGVQTEAAAGARETDRQPPPAEESAPPEPSVAKIEASEPEPVARGTRLTITDYGVGRGVQNRRLVGESDRFAPGTKVWFWTRVQGGRGGDRIRHVWRHEGRTIASIPLKVGSANWRTQSNKTMYAGSEGAWTVEAVDPAGHVLARARFDCRR
jgi:cytoskeleton protein RodZ